MSFKKLFLVTLIAMSLILLIDACAAPAAPGGAAEVVVTETPYAPVAILVIDDFQIESDLSDWSINRFIEQKNLLKSLIEPMLGLAGQNCVVTPQGQQHFPSVGATSGESSSGHGWLVYGKFDDQLLQPDPDVSDPREEARDDLPSWMQAIKSWQAGDHRLYLVAMDTEGYTTQVVRDHIVEAIQELNARFGIKRFVLNMSFAIVPCPDKDKSHEDLDTDYRKAIENYLAHLREESPDIKALEDLLNELAGKVSEDSLTSDEAQIYLLLAPYFGPLRLWIAYGGPSMDQMTEFGIQMRDQKTQSEQDPLYVFLTDPQNPLADIEDLRVISIASAGNLLDVMFPWAPAIWDSVVSVSALNEGLIYSNWGEVAIPSDGGTSLSAPVLSHLAAKHLHAGGDVRCAGGDGESWPPLGYRDELGPFDNEEVNPAIEKYCRGFPGLP